MRHVWFIGPDEGLEREASLSVERRLAEAPIPLLLTSFKWIYLRG